MTEPAKGRDPVIHVFLRRQPRHVDRRDEHGNDDGGKGLMRKWPIVDLEDDHWTSKRAIKRGLPPMHPGELLREDIVPALGRPRVEIARLLGISRQTLHAILTERTPVTAEMALRLGKLCGNGPELWLNLQVQYDLQRLSKTKRAEIAAIPTLAAE
jgi:antitoxin HigA-1